MIAVILTYDINGDAVEATDFFFNHLENAVKFAKEKQQKFCKYYDIPMEMQVPHQYGENKMYSVFMEINGYGKFLTENNNADRIWVEIKEILTED